MPPTTMKIVARSDVDVVANLLLGVSRARRIGAIIWCQQARSQLILGIVLAHLVAYGC